jgi:Alr-MurF fusion protein
MNYTLHQIAMLVDGKLLGSTQFLVNEIVTDTRAFFHAESSLFVALPGIKRTGQAFVETAYKKGIRAFLVTEKPHNELVEANFILVENTLIALQKLASIHRKNATINSIAITGSYGKTMVKEWLYQLLCHNFLVVKSPKSYNSQLGVPLSVLAIEQKHELGIFEAGISQANEMCNLEQIIQPNLGIITNITTAHLQNFESYENLVQEKIKLLPHCNKIVVGADNFALIDAIKQINPNAKMYSWGKSKNADIQLIKESKKEKQTDLSFVYKQKNYFISIPFLDSASTENCCTVFASLIALDLPLTEFLPKFQSLFPIEMRLEINEGNNNCVVINDCYNADLHSIKVAFEVLSQQKKTNKTLILSALHKQYESEENYKTIANWANKLQLKKTILIGSDIIKFSWLFHSKCVSTFETTQEFIDRLHLETFSGEAILVKGSFSFAFNRISDLLKLRSHDTVLEINLKALNHNLNLFKSKLQPNTKIMCMVKAFGYGTGGYEIAQTLEYSGVDYLGVAYADEGAALRKDGISLPIIVMNPEQSSYDTIIKNQLEPEIYSIRVLEKFLQNLTNHHPTSVYPIHIKIDTGMNRLGFKADEVELLVELLIKYDDKVEVKSIFTHLSASEDENERKFTLSQFIEFDKIYDYFSNKLNTKPIKHALNSAGILRYSTHQYNMVRLGIGLYGFVFASPIELENVIQFKTVISQIKTIKKGESVSYNRRFIAEENKKIAVLPVGYADGIPRRIGNGVGFVSIQGKVAKILGTICMDTMMVDVSCINCQEGDEVCLIGNNPTLEAFSTLANTIPYEILTSISQRVKRVYYKE